MSPTERRAVRRNAANPPTPAQIDAMRQYNAALHAYWGTKLLDDQRRAARSYRMAAV